MIHEGSQLISTYFFFFPRIEVYKFCQKTLGWKLQLGWWGCSRWIELRNLGNVAEGILFQGMWCKIAGIRLFLHQTPDTSINFIISNHLTYDMIRHWNISFSAIIEGRYVNKTVQISCQVSHLHKAWHSIWCHHGYLLLK